MVAVHCIKDPGLWGWSLGSSQSCHFKMGLCLPARDRKKKKNKACRAEQPNHTLLSPNSGPNPASRNSLSIRRHTQDSVDSDHTLGPRSRGLQLPAPPTGSPLQQEQYSSSMTRKQLSSKALGRTNFRLRFGVLRSDNTASKCGPISTSWEGGNRTNKEKGTPPQRNHGSCLSWSYLNKIQLPGTRRL